MARLFSLYLHICKQMARKKYFCDFCQRSFNDDVNTRSKHLNSVAHIKAKTEHYEMFKDPEIILKENSVKKPCRRFHNDGFCQFGSSCIYSHYSSYQLDFLRQEIARAKAEKNFVNIPLPEVFCQKYYEIKQKSSKQNVSTRSHDLPLQLLPVADGLPPSMQPFDIRMYNNIELCDWG